MLAMPFYTIHVFIPYAQRNTLYVLSVQATVLLHEQVNGILETYVPIYHESWDIGKQ